MLVHAGAGGLGSVAVQPAKARGAHVATTASAATAGLVEELGADEVVDHRAHESSRGRKRPYGTGRRRLVPIDSPAVHVHRHAAGPRRAIRHSAGPEAAPDGRAHLLASFPARV
ncbi:hypothetical protein GCM10010282_53940 [Streptomyces roseolus]|nr:hypothetical protein GCM10010282_53940 [Streptomyces roseolus]